MNTKRIYRLPPCAGYEIDNTERWLSEQAQKGRILAKDGFFAGFACFECGEPRELQYRLTAAQKSTSMWADDMGEPDADEVELSEKYGWEYVAKRGEFYIYRTENPDARELNTDPEVQALALETVKKRKGVAGIELVIWVILFCAMNHWGGSLTMLMLSMHSWFFLLTALLIVSSAADAIRMRCAFRRMQKQLREEGGITDPPLRPGRYYGGLIFGIALMLLWIGCGLHLWSDELTDADKAALADYTGTLPFAAMEEFAGGEVVSEEEMMRGLQFNSVEERSDLLAGRIIRFRQHARLKTADGKVLDGGMYVDYLEMRTEWMAKRLAKGLLREAQHEKNYVPLDMPLPEADFAAAYTDLVHFPNLLLRKGNIVARVQFFQAGPQEHLPDETWMAIFAESIRP